MSEAAASLFRHSGVVAPSFHGFGHRLARWYFFLIVPVLFVQAALVNIDGMSIEVVKQLKTIDEVLVIGLVALTAMFVPSRPSSYNKRLSTYILIYVAAAVASAAYNGVTAAAAASSVFLFVKGYLVYFCAARLIITHKQVRWYMTFLLASFTLFTVIAFLQVAGVPLPWHLDYRYHLGFQSATSIFNHHTRWGTASAIGVSAALSYVLVMPNRRRWLPLLAMLVVGMWLSTSRRHVVAVPFAFFACAWVFLPDAAARLKRFIPYAAVTFLLLVVLSPLLARWVQGTYDEYITYGADRDRYVLYQGGFDLAVESPIFGRGPGTYGSWTSVTTDSPVYWELGIDRLIPIHYMNGAPFASYLGEGGFVGLGLVLVIFASMGRRIITLARKLPTHFDRALGAMVFIVFIDGLFETFVHPFFTGSIATYLFFGSFGMLEARFRHHVIKSLEDKSRLDTIRSERRRQRSMDARATWPVAGAA